MKTIIIGPLVSANHLKNIPLLKGAEIITHSDQLLGRHENMTILLSNGYELLPHWDKIKQQITNLQCADEIKINFA